MGHQFQSRESQRKISKKEINAIKRHNLPLRLYILLSVVKEKVNFVVVYNKYSEEFQRTKRISKLLEI